MIAFSLGGPFLSAEEMFVDPRSNPQPPFRGQMRRAADDATELSDLHRLCRTGRIYEVERWIQDGRPIHAAAYRTPGKKRIKGALEIAIETNQYDLAVLLLCNGFPPDCDGESLLVRALENRQRELFELLLSWGADPLWVDPYTIVDSYDADLIERFWMLGVDLTGDHVLARALSEHSSNRPAYGWARRHKDDPRIAKELSMALGAAVVEGRERAVALLMWAGADSHQKTPDLRYSRYEEEEDYASAIALALIYGHGHLLPTLKPHPSRDNFEELWSNVCDAFAIDHLGKIQRPKDWSRALMTNIRHAVAEYRSFSTAMECIEKLTISYEARLTSATKEEIAWLRRDLLRCGDDNRRRWILRWMSYAETCEPAIYSELTNTSAMRSLVAALRIRDSRYR